MTSFFVQVWTLPQCAHVNFCVFTFAIGQRAASMVRPVSVSFDVEGQRTSRLLILRPAFALGRLGGSKKNRVAMSESINDASLAGVVWRHLHSYSITDSEANETFAHLSGDVRENKMFVRKCDTKHRPGKHHHNGALQFDGFFGIHLVVDLQGASVRRRFNEPAGIVALQS